MFSQAKIGYAGPSPPPVRLALRPVTPALSQRVRSLGDCSDRIALEKSESVTTTEEVINPLLTKTTVVRRMVRSEYTARYEQFCQGGDKVKSSSSEFWEEQHSGGGSASILLQPKSGKRAEPNPSVASSAFRQLFVTEPKEVQAYKGPHTHHAKEAKGSNCSDALEGDDSGAQGEHHGHPSKPVRRRSSIVMGSLLGQGARRRSVHQEGGKMHGRDAGSGNVSEAKESTYVTSFKRFISESCLRVPSFLRRFTLTPVCSQVR